MNLLLIDCLFLGLGLGGLRSPWALAAVSALLWSAAFLRRPRLREAPAARLWAVGLAWALLSALASAEVLRGLAGFSRLATQMLFFALACLSWRRADRRLWLHFLCGTGWVLGLAALALPSPGYPMVGLLYPYHNYTACALAASFSACWGALSSGYPRRAEGKAALLASMAFFAAVALKDGSRGAVIAAAAALALASGRRRPRLLAGLAVGALAVFAAVPVSRLAGPLKLDRPEANMRLELWRSALAAAGDHPILGEGPGQFDRGFLRHNFPAPAGTRPTRYGLRSAHAHSEPLQTAAELGWPGLGLLLSAVGLCLLKARRSPRDPFREAGLCAFTAMSTQAFFDNVLALPALGLLYGSALAVASGEPSLGEGKDAIPRGAFLLGLLLCAAAWWPAWAARVPASAGAERLRQALRAAPEDSDLWEDLARAYLESAPPQPGRALEALSQAERRNPTNALYPMLAAEISRAQGRWDAAGSLARRALELEPEAPQARLLLAEALLRLGRKRDAARELAAFKTPDALIEKWEPRGYDAAVLRYDGERYPRLRALTR